MVEGCNGLVEQTCSVCSKNFRVVAEEAYFGDDIYEMRIVCSECDCNSSYRKLKQTESEIYKTLQNHIPEYMTDITFEDLYDEIKDEVMALYNCIIDA